MIKVSQFRLIEKTARNWDNTTPRQQREMKSQAAVIRSIVDRPTEQIINESHRVNKKLFKGFGKGLLIGGAAGIAVAGGGAKLYKIFGGKRILRKLKNLESVTKPLSAERNIGMRAHYTRKRHLKYAPGVAGSAALGGTYGGTMTGIIMGGRAANKEQKSILKEKGFTIKNRIFKSPEITMTPTARKKYYR